MRQSINGKIYDTANMTVICERSAYHNGNYTGDESIRVTHNGNYAYVVTSNGQDLYRRSSIEAIRKEDIAELIDGWRLDDGEAKALAAIGVLSEA